MRPSKPWMVTSPLPAVRRPLALRRVAAFSRLFAMAFAIATIAAPAAPAWSAGVKPPPVKLEYEKYTLANGLEVILREDHRLPIVAVNVWYHVGPANEEAGQTGFAHLFEHMMYQASGHIPEDQILKILEGAGASFINGSTAFDRTNYLEDLPSNQLETALWVESDRMGFLLDRLDSASLAIQQDVVRNERRQRTENAPYQIAREELFHLLFPKGHPYYAAVIGSHEDIQAANLESVREFFRRYYCPNNASLAIVGDIDKAKTKSMIQKYFGTIQRGQNVPPITVQTPPITSERRAVVTDRVTLPRVTMAWLTSPFYKPGDAELDIVANVLGGGKASRLYKSLVYEKQLCQDVSVTQQSLTLASVLQITATLKPGHTPEEVEKAIDEELDRFLAGGPTPDELAATQNSIYSDAITSLEQIGGFSGVADRLNMYNQHLGDPGYINKDLARYAVLTPAGVKGAAAAQLGKQNRVVVYAVPGEKKLPPDPPAPPKPERSTASVDSREPWRNTQPPAGPAPKLQLPSPKQFALPNGLAVYFVETHYLPVVSANVVLRSGSAADPPALPGLADFTASMLDEGTTKRDALQIANQVHDLGALLVTSARTDDASAGVRSLKHNSTAALSILSDILLSPTFPEAEITRVRSEQITAIVQQRDQPGPTASLVLRSCLFGPTNPYGHLAIGTEEALKQIDREDLVSFYQSVYSPKNAALILVGDLTESEARKLAAQAFGSWKGDAAPLAIPPAGTTIASRVVIVDKPGSPQTTLLAGQMGVMRSDPDYETLNVMNTVLGGLFSSRLNMNLREDKGYTYGATSVVGQNRGVGAIMMGADVQADATGASIEEILNEAAKMKASGLTAEELALAKDSIVRSLPASFEATYDMAGTLASIYIYDLPIDYYRTLPVRVEAITQAEVLAAAQKHLTPDRMVVVAVGDRSQIEPQISKLNLGTIVYRDADGNEVSASN